MSGDKDHISFEMLVDFDDGRLSGPAAERVLVHLDSCRECAETLGWIAGTMALMQTDRQENAPAMVINQAVRAFAAPERRFEPATIIRRLVGHLQFDSGGLSPALGFRSGHAVARQLLFSTDEADIDLRLTPAGEQWELSGQILGDCQEGAVELLGGDVAVRTAVDDLAEFRLPPVDAGMYQLVVRWSDIEIEIPGLSIGDGHGTS